ncbi:hypothetical protein [Leptolyngbya sp. FACHB-261]|uniref:hypothetical protein n=1 Tax=Leptolyngbya sp. FACHB-261 TaxID=2692806 RepID=UPI00168940B4|nr:hypothetical protein [Leptolyngbya sp. FACHB-261]MBD2104871.1 hypothetical protein [Leptolyngbya sp. FACHB-261]
MKTFPRSALPWMLGLALTLSLATGCAQLAGFGIGLTNIEAIQQQPRNYTKVYVGGTVGNQVGLLGTSVYELKQGDSTIWVLTKQQPPPSGSTVRLEANVQYQGIVVSNVDLGKAYLEEIRRL